MNHKAYQQIIPNANSAILFIHGILGSPDHFDFMISHVPHHISIYNMLLDGHGKGVRDFSHTSMRKWETQVSEAVMRLSQSHDQIYIVAHSMGTLFAIHEAVKSPKIKSLFLLAVPICPFPRLQMFSNAYKVYTGKIRNDDLHGLAAKAACSIQHDAGLLTYLPWLKRYLELFHKVKTTRQLLPSLETPCIAFQSKHDEMVSFHSVAYLNKYSNIDIHVLNHSWHNLYGPEDRQTILNHFSAFLEQIK